jgi:hypothetical protein
MMRETAESQCLSQTMNFFRKKSVGQSWFIDSVSEKINCAGGVGGHEKRFCFKRYDAGRFMAFSMFGVER